jgi:hypothetical protein
MATSNSTFTTAGTTNSPNFNKTNVDRSQSGYVVDTSRNDPNIPASTPITGHVYAFNAVSTFSVDQTFDTIRRLTQTIINQYDVTGAIEVLMNVAEFNKKIGIIKNENNNYIFTNAEFTYDGRLVVDEITFTAEEFVSLVPVENIVSVGKFSTIYTDFINYVGAYFGTGNGGNEGFSTLFTGDEHFNPNNGVFDASALHKLINSPDESIDPSGRSLTKLRGNLTIKNLTQLLANAVDSNVFGNRDPINGTAASGLDGEFNSNNYGINDGFIAGDLLFVASAGLSVTLKLGLDTELYLSPLNNKMGLTINNLQPYDFVPDGYTVPLDPSGGVFASSTNTSTTLIERNLTGPLLIRLIN